MIFLDSSFIIAFYNIRDENHVRAKSLMPDIVNYKYGPLYIFDYVFDEIVTVIFIRLRDLRKAVRIGEYLRKSVELVEVTGPNFEEAWRIFKKQKETDFSFTDCTSISIMRRMNIRNIATFDSDFLKLKEVNVIGAS